MMARFLSGLLCGAVMFVPALLAVLIRSGAF